MSQSVALEWAVPVSSITEPPATAILDHLSDEELIQSQLKQCKEDIEWLQGELEYKWKYRAELKAQLNQIHLDRVSNALGVINKVPEEILISIFLEVVNDHSIGVGKLLLVCRRWHLITINYPSLWTRIISAPSGSVQHVQNLTKYLTSAIRYSSNRPLDIELNLFDVGNTSYWRDLMADIFYLDPLSNEETDLSAWLECLASSGASMNDFPPMMHYVHAVDQHLKTLTGKDGEVARRWKSLRLKESRDAFNRQKYVETLFRHPLELLDYLAINTNDWHPYRSSIHNLPSLKTYSSNSVYDLGLVDPRKVKLTSLAIAWSWCGNTLQGATLFENLQTLHLDYKETWVHSYTIAQVNGPLEFGQLRTLSITGRFAQRLQTQLAAPRLDTMYLLNTEATFSAVESSLYLPALRSLFLHASPGIAALCNSFTERFTTIQEVALVHEIGSLVTKRLADARTCKLPPIRGYVVHRQKHPSGMKRNLIVEEVGGSHSHIVFPGSVF